MGNFGSTQSSVYQIDKLIQLKKGSPSNKYELISQTQQKYPEEHQLEPLSYYNGIKTKQGNIFWSGISSLAYQNLKRYFLHNQNIKFKNIQKQKLIVLRSLDNPEFFNSNIYKNQVYIKNGIESQIISDVNKEILQKFPKSKCHDMHEKGSHDRIITYSYLHKILEDKNKLFEEQIQMKWFGKQLKNAKQYDQSYYKVEAFGTTNPQTLKHIKVINYMNQNSFLIGFQFQNLHQIISNQQNKTQAAQKTFQVVYILVSQQKQTFKSVIQKVIKSQLQKPFHQRPQNKKTKQFMMPVLDIDIKHKFKDFIDLQIQNEQLYGKKFKMIEHFRVKVIQTNKEVNKIEQKNLYDSDSKYKLEQVIKINKPFWIIFTKQGKHPYFVGKINQISNHDHSEKIQNLNQLKQKAASLFKYLGKEQTIFCQNTNSF